MSSEKHTTGAPVPDERPRFEPERWALWEKESIAHFIRAMSRARDAMNSYASLIRRGNYTPVNIEIAVSIPMTEARDAAELARPEVLTKLHPDLPRVWRQTFMQVVGMNAIWTMAGRPPFSDESSAGNSSISITNGISGGPRTAAIWTSPTICPFGTLRRRTS